MRLRFGFFASQTLNIFLQLRGYRLLRSGDAVDSCLDLGLPVCDVFQVGLLCRDIDFDLLNIAAALEVNFFFIREGVEQGTITPPLLFKFLLEKFFALGFGYLRLPLLGRQRSVGLLDRHAALVEFARRIVLVFEWDLVTTTDRFARLVLPADYAATTFFLRLRARR